MILIKESEDPLNILFSCRILALSTFRIPTFGDIIMTAISDLQPPVESDIPDMRYDVLNQYEGDESSDESDSVTTESYTGSFSFSYGNSFTSHALSVEESSESSYESDSSETTSSSSSSHESSQDPPTMLLRFETDPSIHETSLMGPSELMDSLRNQQDGLPYDVPPEPNLYPDSPKLPPLRVIDYSRVVEELCSSTLHSVSPAEHSEFVLHYPSLYFWYVVSESSIPAGNRDFWQECFSARATLLMRFIGCWSDLCHHYAITAGHRISFSLLSPAMLFSAVPGFFNLLRVFVPALQSTLVGRYSSGVLRHAVSESGVFLESVLWASERFLADETLLDMWVSVAFGQCNALVVGDVVFCGMCGMCMS